MKNKTLLSGLVVISLSGCALTTESVDIKYISQSNIVSIPDAKQVTINVRVHDIRLDKSKISSKKNGYGMETAPILANDKVEVTVTHAIEKELISRGFRLSSNAQVHINADISQFYADHKMGFLSGDTIADFDMITVVQTNTGQQVYSKRIKVQGIEKDIQLMDGENAALALNLALKSGIKMLFDDSRFIASLMLKEI